MDEMLSGLQLRLITHIVTQIAPFPQGLIYSPPNKISTISRPIQSRGVLRLEFQMENRIQFNY